MKYICILYNYNYCSCIISKVHLTGYRSNNTILSAVFFQLNDQVTWLSPKEVMLMNRDTRSLQLISETKQQPEKYNVARKLILFSFLL